jgi:L-arabinokinase
VSLVVYVSGHGFGHATRSIAWLRALRERAAGLEIHVRTEAPHWLFEERGLEVSCSAAPVDPGVLQTTSLDIDAAGTLAAHAAFLAGWGRAVEREAAFLREVRAELVVADIPPLAFAAARRAGVPSLAVGNFCWDWIFGCWARRDPRWREPARRYREAAGLAEAALRAPLHGDFSAFREVRPVAHVVNRSRRKRAACRADLGVNAGDRRRLVLVSFGGFGGASLLGGTARGDLSGYRFVALEPNAPRGLPGDWVFLPRPAPLPHEDIVHACDAVIGKAGYGTVAEAIAHRTRFLFLPRRGFPEVPVLERGLREWGAARSMPRRDFAAGRWRRHLDALFEGPPPPAPPPCDGARAVASAVSSWLADQPR